MIQLRIERPSTLETDLYPPIKRHLERLGLEVKGEVCGCDLVALSDGSPELVVIGEMKQSFTLELVLQAVDRTSVCDEVWLAVARLQAGARPGERRAREEALSIPWLRPSHRHRRWPGRRGGGASAMEAEARRQTAFAHRRGASSPQGGSHRGRFNSDATNDRLSSAGARRGKRACQRAELSAGPSDTCSGRRQNPSGQCLWLVRANRTWALRADLARSRRPRHMGWSFFRRDERRIWREPQLLSVSGSVAIFRRGPHEGARMVR